jgi:two-component system, OmpR family, response regulator
MQKRIVVVEDDREQAEEVKDYLQTNGFHVQVVGDGRAFRALMSTGEPDLIVLDINLPGESGLTLLQELRRDSDVPVLALSGRIDPIDRVVGLELGADDYVAKPYHPRELLARINAVLRRSMSSPRPAAAASPASETVCFLGFTLDVRRRQLSGPDGREIALTSSLFKLLEAGVRRPGRTLTREFLTRYIFGREWQPADRSVDNLVALLRGRMSGDGDPIVAFKSVRGAGYVFAAEVSEPPDGS